LTQGDDDGDDDENDDENPIRQMAEAAALPTPATSPKNGHATHLPAMKESLETQKRIHYSRGKSGQSYIQ